MVNTRFQSKALIIERPVVLPSAQELSPVGGELGVVLAQEEAITALTLARTARPLPAPQGGGQGPTIAVEVRWIGTTGAVSDQRASR
jgi:hypothetical protein